MMTYVDQVEAIKSTCVARKHRLVLLLGSRMAGFK